MTIIDRSPGLLSSPKASTSCRKQEGRCTCFSLRAIAALAAAATGSISFAAECARSDFATGLGDWAGSGGAEWVAEDGVARCIFPPDLLPMRTDLVIDQPCSFTGNYREGDIALIGFDIRSAGVPPSSVCFELRRGTNYLRCYFFGSSTADGQWRTFVASVEPLAPVQGWRGHVENAAFILESVERVSISVWGGSPNSEQVFDFDNIFVCSLPRPSGMAFNPDPAPARRSADDESGAPAVTWAGLHPGLVYHVETAADPRGPWTHAESFTAAAATVSTMLPGGTSAVARLRLDPFLGP